MLFVVGLIVGLFVGASVGIFCAALMIASSDREQYDNLYKDDELKQ